jgi:trimethylamine---corrinoid protein Co-methyltransferase
VSDGTQTQRGRARRGGRSRTSDTKTQVTRSQPVSMVRRIPPAEFLSQQQISLVHDYSMRVLEKTGIEFMLPEALDVLEKNGCRIDRETGRAYIPRQVVESWIAKAPSQFDLQGANPSRCITLGGDNIAFGSVASAPNTLNSDRGRQTGTHNGFRDLLKISHALNTCSFMSGYPVEPIDLPVNTRHLDCYHDMLTMTDKPFRIYSIGKTRVNDAIKMVRIAHQVDAEQMAATPRLMTNMNVNSPLRVDGPLLEGAMEMVRAGQIVVVTPVAFSGAMAPISLSGTLIQFNAECLACIAFLQMVQPGAPVMYGSVLASIDMKSGAPILGSPELVTGFVATGQLARHYGIPMRGFLGATSKAVDAQAAHETLMCIWANVLAGVHCVFHAHGLLDGGLIASYEKAVLDSDLISIMQVISSKVDFSDADEALAAIDEVGPGGHFLGSSHTMSRYEDAFHTPILSDWRPYEFWQDDGSLDTAARAKKYYERLLADYTPPQVDPAVAEALDAFVTRRKEEIGSDEIY